MKKSPKKNETKNKGNSTKEKDTENKKEESKKMEINQITKMDNQKMKKIKRLLLLKKRNILNLI